MDPVFIDLYPNLKNLNTTMFRIRHEVEACVLSRAYAELGIDPILKVFYSKPNNRFRSRGLPVARLMQGLSNKLPNNFYVAGDIPWAVYICITKNERFAKIGLSKNPCKRAMRVEILGKNPELRFCQTQSLVFYGFADRASAQAFETALKRATKAFVTYPPDCRKGGYTEWRAWTPECRAIIKQAIPVLGKIERATLTDFSVRFPNDTVFDLLPIESGDVCRLSLQESREEKDNVAKNLEEESNGYQKQPQNVAKSAKRTGIDDFSREIAEKTAKFSNISCRDGPAIKTVGYPDPIGDILRLLEERRRHKP